MWGCITGDRDVKSYKLEVSRQVGLPKNFRLVGTGGFRKVHCEDLHENSRLSLIEWPRCSPSIGKWLPSPGCMGLYPHPQMDSSHYIISSLQNSSFSKLTEKATSTAFSGTAISPH